MKKVSVLGFGYVGAALAGCFANEGFKVLGMDVNKKKNEMVLKGISPFKEKEVSALLTDGINNKLIDVTTSIDRVLKETDVSFICVGTPTADNGEVNLDYIKNVAKELAKVLIKKNSYHLFVIRSTVPPGTSKEFIKIISEVSNKKPGRDFGVCMNPEFLREGSSVNDFYNPPFTVIGQLDDKSGLLLEDIYHKFGLDDNVFRVKLEEAEVFKYFNNIFHALKICFTNEVGRVCAENNIDGTKIMEIFVKDKILNLSPYYMKPGFSFGGSCLPKDVRGVLSYAKENNLKLFQSIMPSNDAHLEYAYNKILLHKPKKILFSGITFKKGTDDFRESPYLRLMAKLINSGIDVKFFDKWFVYNDILGANRKYVGETLPNMIDFQLAKADINDYDMIIIGSTNYFDFEELKAYKGKIFDLSNILKKNSNAFKQYLPLT